MGYHSNKHITMTNVKRINKFVMSWLSTQDEHLQELWMHSSNQRKLKLTINKPEKDPNAPKRPQSAYLYFCSRYRARVKDELDDDVNTTAITRELGRTS